MANLLQFSNVVNERFGTLSFSVATGELAILRTATKEAKAAIMDLCLGDLVPETGSIFLDGQSPLEMTPGMVGWVAGAGGLISNLKVWENITLPLWYHGERNKRETETAVQGWMEVLHPDKPDWERFMASPVAKLRTSERKLAGLIRALVWSPRLLLVDGSLMDEVDDVKAARWQAAMEKFVQDDANRSVLVVCHSPTRLNWKTIGNQ